MPEYIRDFKQRLREVIVRWPEVLIFFRHPSMPQVREFKIPRGQQRWKRRLKVYSRSFIFYRDYSNSLTLSNVGELSWGWSRAVTPHGKEMLRKTVIKTGDVWANSGLVFHQSYSRVSMGWCLLRLSAKTLALLRLSVNFLQLRLTKKLKINFFCFKKLNIN